MKLVGFLQKLKNETVTVELKNGTSVTGTIVRVDRSMNVQLRAAKLTGPSIEPQTHDLIAVRGNTIRDIILPESINIEALLGEEARAPAKRT